MTVSTKILSRALHYGLPPFSAASTFAGLGFVFDIDGVLLRGKTPLPNARESLQTLLHNKVPFLFLTNGGGELESSKAHTLSKLLDIPIHPFQVVLSHTPMKPLCSTLANSRVLVLGCKDVVAVAKSYGLTKVDTAMDLLRDNPSIYPFIDVPKDQQRQLPHRDEPFGAVFVLHDPNSWGLEIQVALDVLRGGDGAAPSQVVPYYASNPDLTFAGAYRGAPRLAGGAFTHALKATWDITMPHSMPLQTTFFGKPTRETYYYAGEALTRWARWADSTQWYTKALGIEGEGGVTGSDDDAAPPPITSPPARPSLEGFKTIVMVGDNPKADIAGANLAGGPWRSALVRTGVWQGEELSNNHTPTRIFEGVGEVVSEVLNFKGANKDWPFTN